MTDWSPPASDAGWQPPESDRPRLSPEEEALNTQIEGETGAGEVAAAVLPQFVNPAPAIGYIKGMLTPGGDSLETARRFQRASTYEPRTEAGKAALGAIGDVASKVKAAAEPIIRSTAAGPLYDLSQTDTGKEVTERAGDIASILPVVGAVSRVARGARAVEAVPHAEPNTIPPTPIATPLTANDIRTSPERLTKPAPATAPEAPPAPAAPTPGNPVTDASGAVRYASLQELAEKGGRAPPTPPPERVPVPGKPHIKPKAVPVEPEPVAGAPPSPETATGPVQTPSPSTVREQPAPVNKAPKFTPPQQEGKAHGAVSADDQASRKQTLHDLNEASGGRLGEVRTSAITGGYDETKQDFQHAQSPDAGGARMGGVIAGESDAVKAASKKAVDETGGVAKGTSDPALQERGTIIDRALTGIRDWFDTNVNALYQGADKAAGGVPMTKFDAFHNLLADPSEFTGVEGMQLQKDVGAMAKHFGLVGDDGFWKPTTIENVERFRQWVGRQYKPGSGNGRAIGLLKGALDDDAAAHGGENFYAESRALRQKQDAMIEGPKGIAKLIPEKNPDGTNSINRPVPIANIADHIANLPKEQFDHIINVLHDSGKLGKGELAENSAAALNEIKAHMAERLHEAGSKTRDGMWDPYRYHEQLNKYSLKMPSVFAPAETSRFQTINRAGNTLRMDKRYPGASAQAQIHGGMGLRERLGNAAESELGALLPPGANTIGELTGVSQKLRDTFKGGGGSKHLAEVEGRITKLGERGGAPEPSKPTVTPLGQVLRGGKQGGFIGERRSPVTNNASGESAASVEAINRGSRNLDLVKPDGSHEPVIRGVNQVDQQAPNGHLLVDRDTNEIVSRGQDLNAQNANGLRARYVAQREPTTPLGQRLVGRAQRGSIGYHGTPHEFAPTEENPLGAFDPNKIGSGEGAQAYGHGIYVAENPDVAGTYRTAGAPAWRGQTPMGHVQYALDSAKTYGLSGPAADTFARHYLVNRARELPAAERQPFYDAMNNFDALKKGGGGTLYHVDVPDKHIAKMLDWDKPLSEQSPQFQKYMAQDPRVIEGQKAAAQRKFEEMELVATNDSKLAPQWPDLENPARWNVEKTGSSLIASGRRVADGTATPADRRLIDGAFKEYAKVYRAPTFSAGLERSSGLSTGDALQKIGIAHPDTGKAVSSALRSMGYPGIKYLDAGSRASEGTRNFVLFDPSIAKILKKTR